MFKTNYTRRSFRDNLYLCILQIGNIDNLVIDYIKDGIKPIHCEIHLIQGSYVNYEIIINGEVSPYKIIYYGFNKDYIVSLYQAIFPPV